MAYADSQRLHQVQLENLLLSTQLSFEKTDHGLVVKLNPLTQPTVKAVTIRDSKDKQEWDLPDKQWLTNCQILVKNKFFKEFEKHKIDKTRCKDCRIIIPDANVKRANKLISWLESLWFTNCQIRKSVVAQNCFHLTYTVDDCFRHSMSFLRKDNQ